MSINYGINIAFDSVEKPDIKIKSDEVIAICSAESSVVNSGLFYADSPEDIINVLATDKVGTAANAQAVNDAVSSISNTPLGHAISDIEKQSVDCPIIISNDSDMKNAISNLKNAPGRFEKRPSIVVIAQNVTDRLNSDQTSELKQIVDKLSAIAIVDVNVTPVEGGSLEAQINSVKSAYKSKRLFLVDRSNVQVKRGSNLEDSNVSALVAGLLAKLGGEENGFAISPSFKKIEGISQGGHEFSMGNECDANTLREEGINSIIFEDGYRLWGDKTNADTSVLRERDFDDVRKLRIFDTIGLSIKEGLIVATDANALDALPYVETAVLSLFNRLKGAQAVLGFSFEWDRQQNTNASVARGEFYVTVYMQVVPTVKKLKITITSTDQYGDVLFDLIEEAA